MKPLISCDRCLEDKVQCRFKAAQFDSCKGCTALDVECIWTRISKPQPPDISYIRYLEGKITEVETYIKRTHPHVKTKRHIEDLLEREVGHSQTTRDVSIASGSGLSISSTGQAVLDIGESPTLSQFIRQSRLADFGSSAVTNDENIVWEAKPISLHEIRYYGHSSTCVLSRDAIFLRHDCHSGSRIPSGLSGGSCLRPEFWKSDATEMERLQKPFEVWETDHIVLDLPPDELMPILLNSYFENTYFPVVHRQLFEKQLREGVHEKEKPFLRLVMLVCANGARWCNDPRVLDERWPVSRSAGHRWIRQFELWHKSLMTTDHLSLWDAQALVLVGMFFCGSSATYGAWVTIGAAIRIMQDIGSHRRKVQQSLESELHKRCFWAMLLLDRLHSVHFGRNGAIADSDFDLDNVLEVDDELWSLEPNAPPPIQPPEAPPKLRVFNRAIELTRISGRCLQTVYALDQTKRLLGIDGPKGLAWMVNDINSRLLNWAHSMPLDLQLCDQPPPDRKPVSTTFINMWAAYYEMLISINRPFITRSSELAASCLAICREGAKAFAKMARVHCRSPDSHSKFISGLCYPAFSSAMVLAMDLIMQDHPKGPPIDSSGPSLDLLEDTDSRQQKEEDIRTCIQVLEDGEEYFQLAGKLRDVLSEFESALRLQPLATRRASSTLCDYTSSDSATVANKANIDTRTSVQSSIIGGVAPQSLDEANMPFDILSGYEFANPYFLECGIAAGFPQSDQLSGDMAFPSDLPEFPFL
ncbi:unnamed protein product [Rhizoctonia solani]|uniref:Xylanolytic transcriptional activator regulatory domain-containing protein n=1 Tax=Rhizoctonia solani TaxID=456999 RepID=A0A8H3DYD8_9AGAM|nr:unnamed protein product [Rhizoctonia solani]